MIETIKTCFPQGNHYLVIERQAGDLDKYLIDSLYSGTEKAARHNLWGAEAQRVSRLGGRIGWIPENLPFIFFSDSVLKEIALGFAASRKECLSDDADLDKSRELLQAFQLDYLQDQQPFQLSDGEMKLVWLLAQFAKAPDYLFAGNLPAGLSAGRVSQIVSFLLAPEKLLSSGRGPLPTLILGCSSLDAEWVKPLAANERWTTGDLPNKGKSMNE